MARRARKRNSKMSFKKRVQSIINLSTELKTKSDTEDDTSVVAATPFQHNINDFGIAQGVDNDERVGDKLRIKDYSLKIRVFPGSAGYNTTEGHTYRLTAIQKLGSAAFATADIPGPLDFWPNAESVDVKYKILFDKVFRLNPDVDNVKYYTIKLSGKRLQQIVFNDAASTVHKNDVVISLKPLTSTVNQLSLNCVARLRYYDN